MPKIEKFKSFFFFALVSHEKLNTCYDSKKKSYKNNKYGNTIFKVIYDELLQEK